MSRYPSNHARKRLVTAAVAATLSVAACTPLGSGGSPAATAGGSPAGGTSQLTIATGGTGGVYYPLGGGIAEVIRDSVPGYDATVQETNASVDNMQLIGGGGADIAFTLADTAGDAVAGAGDFEGAPVSACALGRVYNNSTQVVTSSDSGIASIEDLRDKVVSLGSPGSGTEIIALRILEAAGIHPDTDIDRQQLSIDDTVAALRDGTIDAGFWSGGLPTGALTDYATTGDLVLLPTGEYAEAMAAAHGEFYVADTIPGGTYQGQDEDVSTVSVPNLIVVNTNMAEDLQRSITEAIFENKDRLVAVHAAAAALDPETAGDIAFMDVCPGARAYFDAP
ncbi:MAG: TAXI family TRAP transporter solute-binding subunit [Chloroflexi bacterium]|nr:TAXI family TRAP transporter solute-binding subunit [Chloroflexota bacterium]